MISKMTNFFHFFLVIIVAFGIDFISNNKIRFRTFIPFILFIIGCLTCLILIHPEIASILRFTNRQPPNLEALSYIASNIFQARFLFFLSLGAILLYLFTKKESSFFVILCIYALDIYLSVGNFNPIEASPGSPDTYFGKNAIINYLQKKPGIYRVDNLWPRNVNMIQQIESTYGYHTVETRPYRSMMGLFNLDNRELIDLMNVKYLITDKDLSNKGFTRALTNLWENNEVLPRVYFVSNARYVSNATPVESLIVNSSFHPKDEVIIKGEGKDILQTSGKAIVSITTNRDDKVVAKVINEKPGFLVFSQFQYPGWLAMIDGKKRSLLPADLSYYAIPIESGDHEVIFLYRSAPLIYGGIISILTGGILIISFSVKKLRKYYFVHL